MADQRDIGRQPGEAPRVIALLDGFSAPAGDTFTLTFDDALDAGDDFSALLSLGIGFGAQPQLVPQFSEVTVNGRPLTRAAGGSDDGTLANGGLITIGGIGEDPANPGDPLAGPDEPTTPAATTSSTTSPRATRPTPCPSSRTAPPPSRSRA